jgi:uncharacterized protein YmfQ (DUF2313 family)
MTLLKTTDDVVALLARLSPRGDGWRPTSGSRWERFLRACSGTLANRINDGDVLLREAIPDGVDYPDQTLAAWESEFGILAEGTEIERRAALLARLRASGGNSEAYFVSLGAAMGLTITIVKHSPWMCSRPPCYPMRATWIRFVWTVHGPAAATAEKQAALIALITKYAPATDTVLWAWDL